MANSYLSRTSGTATNTDICTLSVWIKRSKLSGNDEIIIGEYTDASNRAKLLFNADQLHFFQRTGGSTTADVKTTRVFRDSSAWYHIVIAFDTTQSTNTDRIKFYINGVQETAFANTSYPSSGQNIRINESSITQLIGYAGTTNTYFDGYMSHVAFVDGQALAPTTFGETDSTSGIWKFKTPTGVTFGNNGFHLKFENSGAMGTDSSGNSNTFTVNGNLKQSLDTPSNVHAVMNPLAFQGASNIALTNGNLTATNSASTHRSVFSTFAVSKGKWYFETKIGSVGGNYPTIGIYNADGHLTAADYFTVNANGYGYNSNGSIYHNNSAAVSGQATWTTGDIIGVALDVDNDKVYFSKNGSYINSANPSSGSNGQSITADSTWYFAAHSNDGGTDPVQNYNFGDGFFGTTAITSAGSNGNGSLFEYDVPSGYYALNTKNINTYG